MSHSVSGIRPGSPSQSKSNDSLFAFHMHFPNIHIWTTCFHLFFWFSNRGVRCCSHSLQAGERAFWNWHCWGRPCYKSQGLQLHEFYHNKTHTLTLHARLCFLFQAVWGFLRQQGCRQSWLCGRDDLIPHHTAAEASCVPHVPNNSFLGNLFVHTWTVNQRSAFLSCRRVLLCGKCLSVRFVFHC